MVIRKMYFNNEIFHFPSKVLNNKIINFNKLNMKYNHINNNNKFFLNIHSKWHYIIGIITLLSNLSNGKILPDENGPLSEVQTAVGLEVSMPCDLMPATIMPDATDKVQLVIWYKEGNIKPIYSFDARGKPLQQASHWADEDVLKHKAKFYYDSNPPALRIKNVQRDDAGLYRCRVDFQRSPTRNWRINMTVLVPPTKLSVLDAFGAAIQDNIVGPYNLGTNINLTCLSSGGIPPPRVSWWREHALLDDTYQILPDGTVRNVLQLINISREDLMRVFTCQATNGHVVAPLSSAVKLDMNLPPLYIRLQGLNHPLVAGVRTQITCSSAGARPPPQIIWNKGGIMMRGATQTTSSDGNLTISELVFIPVPEDNEKHVMCSVTGDSSSATSKLDSINYHSIGSTVSSNSIGNNGIFLKDSRVLDVKHAPIVSLNLGAPLDPNNLMKGSDVYLECDIKANPSAKKVEWYHNDEQLHSTRGIIISNQTLVLQGISKITHGQYFCRASNIQGTVSSNEVYLDVKYPPVCKSESTVIRAALKQIVNITCQVDSNPLQNLTYKWSFNNSLETVVDLPQILRHSNRILSSSDNINDHLTSELSENINDDNLNENWSQRRHSSDSNIIAEPYSQMVYSNLAYQQHIDGSKVIRKTHQQQQIQQSQQQQYERIKYHSEFDKRKKHYGTHNHGHHNQQQIPPNNIYRYRVDSFEHFGTVSCVATNFIGQSQPCLYHITPAELPDPIKNCTAFNATANSIQIFCIPGNDGGIHQDFHVEVYDELNQQVLYNISYPYSEFTIKRLPSDSVFVIRVTSYNLQGFSKRAFRVRAKTLSAPLLRTASSTAVLVQLTPLLGALVGVVATLILVALCIVIFIKFRTKNRHPHHRRRSPNDTTTTQTTEPDKGSAEPLSRNMGSHSSLEDKNPDIIPQENSEDEYNLEEKAFDRLNLESQRIKYTPPRLHSTIISSSSPPPLLSSTQPPLVSSPSFTKQYGELSLTTNPSYALYNTPQRIPAIQRPVYTEPPTLLSTKSPSNIYTRIPARSYLPSYETRASPTSPYGSTTTCTIPLLGNTGKQQNSLAISPSSMNPSINGYTKASGNLNSNMNSGKLSPSQSSIQTSLLLNNGSSVLGNYDNDS